ncbi:hypothetical protein M9H77_11803 [Catharanthus roseus]|uniref:Uncharacterized protein n=1 Tax=Catharanthus roseus TaxID=4058 RepID=A0ACC0BFP7_CATRO|nr:hypothetical protein M9H77_11803 [Catharanthus roseus]
MSKPLVMVSENSSYFMDILHHRGVFVRNSLATYVGGLVDYYDRCNNLKVDNEDDDGILENVNVNDLLGLDGKVQIGIKTGKSKIDNTGRVEEQDCAETHVENDGAMQEGSESDEEHRLSLNEFEGFESDGCEENTGKPSKVAVCDGKNCKCKIYRALQPDESWQIRYIKLWDYVEELRSSGPKNQVWLKTFTDAKGPAREPVHKNPHPK